MKEPAQIALESMRAKQLSTKSGRRIDRNEGTAFEIQKVNPEYKKTLNAVLEPPMPLYDEIKKQFWEYILLYLHNHGKKKWIIEEQDKPKYVKICKLLTEQISYLPGKDIICPKSLLLTGPSGKGKTTIMIEFFRAVMIWYHRKFQPVIKAEVMHIQSEGLINTDIIFIDDLGTELNTTRDEKGMLISRSDTAHMTYSFLNNRRMKKLLTNITTNMSLSEMIDVYGSRVAWRLDEQFEVIEL